MKRTIRIPLGNLKQARPYELVSVVWAVAMLAVLGIAIFAHNAGIWFLVVLGSPLLFLAPLMFWGLAHQHRRLEGMEILCSPEGIGLLKDGTTLWLLPWERYGGFREVRNGFWGSILRPYQEGLEILDREQVVRGFLPTLSSSNGNSTNTFALRAAMGQELQAKALFGKKPERERPLFERLSKRKLVASIFIGIVAGSSLLKLSNEVRKAVDSDTAAGWQAWFGEGMRSLMLTLPAALGVFGAFFGVLFLGLIYVSEWEEKRKVENPPVDGPTLQEHSLNVSLDGPVPLREGFRYRYANPEQARHSLVTELKIGRWAMALLALIMVSLSLLSRLDLIFVLLNVVFWGSLLTVAHFSYRQARAFVDSLDDTLILSHGMLVVVKPDGSHLPLPLPSGEARRTARFRTIPYGSGRYVYDPNLLYEAGPLTPEFPLPLVEEPQSFQGSQRIDV